MSITFWQVPAESPGVNKLSKYAMYISVHSQDLIQNTTITSCVLILWDVQTFPLSFFCTTNISCAPCEILRRTISTLRISDALLRCFFLYSSRDERKQITDRLNHSSHTPVLQLDNIKPCDHWWKAQPEKQVNFCQLGLSETGNSTQLAQEFHNGHSLDTFSCGGCQNVRDIRCRLSSEYVFVRPSPPWCNRCLDLHKDGTILEKIPTSFNWSIFWLFWQSKSKNQRSVCFLPRFLPYDPQTTFASCTPLPLRTDVQSLFISSAQHAWWVDQSATSSGICASFMILMSSTTAQKERNGELNSPCTQLNEERQANTKNTKAWTRSSKKLPGFARPFCGRKCVPHWNSTSMNICLNTKLPRCVAN